ncbi:4-hydroxythreonine-4-phosphate dehydrogenase PdxA [Rhodobacterales bacterium 52_120_T64]|nr:4-hydroxythreonine-4-phosphate dehydrogenase PdxA [Rhodobacterales bacterium 52_120_T64]
MNQKPVALTLGEPAGIGGEITLKAWSTLRDELPFFLIADASHIQTLAIGSGVPIKVIANPSEAAHVMQSALPVLDHPLSAPVINGVPNARNAVEVVNMIERAVGLVQSGQACALTTNPIHKKALQDGADFAFPGHTEFLANLANVERPIMMLSAPELRVVPVTIHIAISKVPAVLDAALLEQTIRVTHQAMITDLGISAPKIAVAGLNPHAGEEGAMGNEEIDFITPTLEMLRAEGMDLAGPMSADTMFHPAARDSYDLAICMYHDQALIPIKTLNFSAGVNTTLGLPFIRTSPDHGTAFDIAGQNIADPQSLIEALRTANEMAKHKGTI